MARLPIPGSDSGTWGVILNDFLEQAHDSVGVLKANSVGTLQIGDGSVTSAKIADGTIVNADISASAAIAQSKVDNLPAALNSKVANASGQTLTLWRGTAAAYTAIGSPDINTIYVIIG